MKNIPETNENNTISNENNSYKYDQVTDTLLKSKGGHSLLECNKELIKSYDLIKPDSMGHKSRFSYRGVLNKNNNVTHEPRSQSLPNSLDIKNQKNGITSNSDNHLKLLPESETPPESPTNTTNVYWFKTWPECNKIIDNPTDEQISKISPSSSKTCDTVDRSEQSNCKQNTFTLNEALQSISLAYSPVTKQLHLVQRDDNSDLMIEEELTKPKLGHHRTEAGSFSSTVSSLSDPSPSGSLLDADERTPSPDSSTKSKRKSLSSLFNR